MMLLAPEISLPHHRAHHRDGQDCGKFHRTTVGGHEIPRGPLGESLASAIGVDAGSVEDGPVVLGECVIGVGMAVADGMERRGEHDPLDAGVPGGTQHAHRALTSRDDDVVLVLDIPGVYRRSHMQHEVAPADGFGPPRVAQKIGCDEAQRGAVGHAGVSEHGPHRTFSLDDRTVVRTRQPTGAPLITAMLVTGEWRLW
jgi:hypothetical protein